MRTELGSVGVHVRVLDDRNGIFSHILHIPKTASSIRSVNSEMIG
jgi:hypothetical protein